MGLGDFISGIFGSENKEKAQPYQVDPNAYQYGGRQGGAQQASDMYGNLGQQNRDVQGGDIIKQQELYGYGQGALNEAQDARSDQTNALSLARMRATGNDLISQRIAAQQQQQLQQQQASAAASSRGPAAMALAQQNAANNTATGQSNIAANAAIAGAQEQLANQQAYASQASGLRGMDINAAQGALGAGAAFGNIGVAQGQLGLGYSQLQNTVQAQQLQAQMQQQAQTSANIGGAQAVNAQVGGQNAGMAQRNAEGLVGLGSKAGEAVASTSDERAKMGISHITGYRAGGGPVHGGANYMVGENGQELYVPHGLGRAQVVGANGPEVITPQDNGFVVPSTIDMATAAPADLKTAATHEAAQRAEYNRIASMGSPNTAERQSLVGMPYTLGLELGAGTYEGHPLGAGTDAQTQKGIAQGMQAAGVRSKDATKAAEKTAQTEAAQAAAAKGIGSRLAGAAGSYGSDLLSNRGAIDTAYHGQGSYVPTQMIQLPMSQSDVNTKMGILPMASAGSGAFGSPTGTTKMSGGGMDVMGSLKANSDFDTQFLRHAGSSPTSYSDIQAKTPFSLSDAAAKAQAFREGKRAGVAEVQQWENDPSYIIPRAGGIVGDAVANAGMGAARGAVHGLQYAARAADQIPTAAQVGGGIARVVDRSQDGVADRLGAFYPTPVYASPQAAGPDTQFGPPRAPIAPPDAYEVRQSARNAAPIAPAEVIAYPKRELVTESTMKKIPPDHRRAGGGPVKANEPYLVGEHGPERMVPLNTKYDNDQVAIPVTDPSITVNGRPTTFVWDQDRAKGWQSGLAPVGPIQGAGEGVQASLSGPAPRYSSGAPVSESKAKAAPPPRKLTNDELMAQANAEIARTRAQKQAALDAGPAVRVEEQAPPLWLSSYMARQQTSDERAKEDLKKQAAMASANRSQAGYSYAYKPAFTPPEQRPGERNVGPMAQNMAADPVARTAVKKDPDTGLLVLDNNKLAKLHSASIASLQDQLDTIRGGLARVLGRQGLR